MCDIGVLVGSPRETDKQMDALQEVDERVLILPIWGSRSILT